jgi:hypothetical protein
MFKLKNIIILIFLLCLIINFDYIFAASQDPQLVTKINSAFKKIQGYLVKLAAPAAGVSIATGVMIRKLSFGNEEKMVIGKKVIVNAVICYGIIISIDLIIKFIDVVIQ